MSESNLNKAKLRVGQRLEASVEKVVFGGPGLCRTKYGVIFVDYAAPQDHLEIEIVLVKKDFARAKLVKIIRPSPDRVAAPCEYFTKCGGCDWQHLAMPAQLKTKQALVTELFQRNFAFGSVLPIIASPDQWNYRNRIQLVGTQSGLSYSQKRSNETVQIQKCLIADETINTLIAKGAKPIAGQRIQLTKDGIESLENDDLAFEFSQVNSRQNENLIDLVLCASEKVNFDRVLDLYGGAGNFLFPLAEKFPKVQGTVVELDPKLVRSAQNLIQKRGLGHRLQAVAGSVESTFGRLPLQPQTLIVVDPPRAGMGPEVSKMLRETSASAIFYVSCNPMTLVRDLKDIITSSKWKIRSVQPLDMFPQTSHIEVLVTLLPD